MCYTSYKQQLTSDNKRFKPLVYSAVVCMYLQIQQGGSSPHCFADLQVVLLPGETGRALVVWGQNFDIDRSNG